MQNTVFLVNDRFTVNVDKSELLDKTTGENNRLEPRLMRLLHLLINQRGITVKREFIIKEIWDNYPGANDGLNQAISFLRKLLADEHKVIIQTQPKVGYSFNGIISSPGKQPILSRKKNMTLIISTLILMTLFFFAVHFFLSKDISSTTNSQLNKKNDAEIPTPDLKRHATKRLLKDTLGSAALGDSLRSN